MTNPKLFFGYPSEPRQLNQTVAKGGNLIRGLGRLDVTLWEELRVAGRFVIDVILQEIENSDLCVFDVTVANQNVMFELGYAIGSNRPVWLLRDTKWEDLDKDFKALRFLTTVGYVDYTSSEDIRTAYLTDTPLDNVTPIFTESIQPTLRSGDHASVFYVMSPIADDSSRAISRRVDEENGKPLPVIQFDPAESTVESLTWVSQQIFKAAVTVVHFATPGRRGADVHNARSALIGGLAHGMGKPVLLLADDDYLTPIDYRDMARTYSTPRIAKTQVSTWLDDNLSNLHARGSTVADRAAQIALATELKNLTLGDHIAENEVAMLDTYFVETPAFLQVISDTSGIFVGRKGSGKTAAFFQAASALSQDRRVLATVIKPRSYELAGVVGLLRKYGGSEVQEFLVEAVWTFLLYTSIAAAAVAEIESRPAGPPDRGSPEWELVNYASQYPQFFEPDFALRLEYAVEKLLQVDMSSSIAATRERIVGALHNDVLQFLRQLLGRVFKRRKRIALIVDNLDKLWDEKAETTILAPFLLGLISATNRLSQDFARDDAWRDSVRVTYAIFLREDVFRYVREVAREPDKLPVHWMRWSDVGLLRRVAELRYEAARDSAVPAGELWDKYFPAEIAGIPASEYLISRILPRPRDLVLLCNAAIATAVAHGNNRVEPGDVLGAEQEYSLFAFEAVQVEGSTLGLPLEDILYAFAGENAYLHESDVLAIFESVSVDPAEYQEALIRLVQLSFLGRETGDGSFEYADQAVDLRKIEILATKLANGRGAEARFAVHPAFRTFLEVVEPIER